MSAVGLKLRRVEGGDLMFFCPGCASAHGVSVIDGKSPRWDWNGSLDKPTFTPSILVSWTWGEAHEPRVCHSWVTDGRIAFGADSTHSLAGMTVDLPDWKDDAS